MNDMTELAGLRDYPLARRGIIMTSLMSGLTLATTRVEAQVIGATVPLSEMFGYSTRLRSMTQGRAVYSMEFSHYEEVPKAKAEEIIAKQK